MLFSKNEIDSSAIFRYTACQNQFAVLTDLYTREMTHDVTVY